MNEDTKITKVEEGICHVRPWVRFWARMFDIYLFTLVLGILLIIVDARAGIKITALETPNTAYLMLNFLFLSLCFYIDTIFLCTWGTSPGRAILRISLVDHDGDKLNYHVA
jgi:uncharacterized RDD family membrane protein YckC